MQIDFNLLLRIFFQQAFKHALFTYLGLWQPTSFFITIFDPFGVIYGGPILAQTRGLLHAANYIAKIFHNFKNRNFQTTGQLQYQIYALVSFTQLCRKFYFAFTLTVWPLFWDIPFWISWVLLSVANPMKFHHQYSKEPLENMELTKHRAEKDRLSTTLEVASNFIGFFITLFS